MERPVLVWIRNDLRFHDNAALYEAALRGHPVLLVYIFDPLDKGPSALGEASRVWLEHSLARFGEEAKRRGFGWVIRSGSPLEVLKSLHRETLASHLMWNRRYEPDGVEMDTEVRDVFQEIGVEVLTCRGNLLVEPCQLLTKKGSPFLVFTPYWQAFQKACPDVAEAPEPYPAKPFAADIYSLSPEELPLTSKLLHWPKKILDIWHPGEESALHTLEQFCLHSLRWYDTKRDVPADDVTSHLSPYLHFGEISPRRIWNMILAHERYIRHPACSSPGEAFLRQLGWREFAHAVLYHFPTIAHTPFREEFQTVKWQKNGAAVKRWQEGKTGIPIVDAGMRQLWETGWIHNRVRLIVASFLVKHLLHSWEEGMAWFWDTLVDADLANNSFNWQWVAGCGVDGAPFFRIFNPVIQSKRFDPDGTYIRKHVPELKALPPEWIHAPWEAPGDVLAEAGISLGREYPKPIIDLEEGRKRALAAFR